MVRHIEQSPFGATIYGIRPNLRPYSLECGIILGLAAFRDGAALAGHIPNAYLQCLSTFSCPGQSSPADFERHL